MGINSKNKLLLCFRPVVDIDVMLDSRVAVDRSSSCRFSCIPVTGKDEMKNSETKSMFVDKVCPELSDNSRMHKPPKRTLSRVIKAMVFETILNRRARRKNGYRQDSYGSNRSYSTYSESSSTGDEKSTLSLTSVDSNIQEINLESQLSGSSELSESKYLSKSEAKQQERRRRDPSEKQKKFDRSGIYFFLISLTLTILLGKILGIILTSIWLYFYSTWDASYRRRKELTKLPKAESRVYKNRDQKRRSARKELS